MKTEPRENQFCKHGERIPEGAPACCKWCENERLRAALTNARAGFDLAYEAIAGDRTDEALLHCGAHAAMIQKVLKNEH